MTNNDRNERLTGYIRQAGTGDPAGLALFYDETSPLAYGLALRILGNAEDAGEIVVDAYHQVWRSAGEYESGRGFPVAWLVVIVRSRALDRLRSRRTHEGEQTLGALASQGPGPEESQAASEDAERVRRKLDMLAPGSRELLDLAFFEGLTHTEIAKKLGQPLGTVKTRIRQALSQVRKLVGNE